MVFDIAVNITDKNIKDPDLLIKNSSINNITPIFVASNVASSRKVLELAEKYNTHCYVGVHPLDAMPTEDLSVIENIRNHGRVLAIGECGLDYFRVRDADQRKTQRDVFEKQLKLCHRAYFLHCRDAHDDFIAMIRKYRVKGVVHSFTGSVEQMAECVNEGLYIGLNGCSLRDNAALARSVPLDRLLAGTDSPYCKIKRNNPHYGFVKTSFIDEKKHFNEPRHLHQVIEVIAGIRGIEKEMLVEILDLNFKKLFNIG